ncbi:hypothetical protein [Aneurinibacillus migulanus]|uniref:Uncharacterized protein n=1 Tax=Aneurinibacillus migulanus TaxID=47500 RepID=A0A0D1XM91_ANEMI|nr:hypothetical protein [Aneurinibacillus migulanus]KIV55406.1 hypothetical protein TS65_16225 [Aneurinibacillus migulanus]KON95029.1 hypothetical protein AF333_05575 [Aneurinibacillus migulanus]MED0892015.1 hypothetical protein [Aneurinibacillus migulanus]MED1618347.1 hypothetical protein [Aneurinibacillus migulanus]
MADGFVIKGLDSRQLLAFTKNKFPRAVEAWCEGLAMRFMEWVACRYNRLQNSFITASMVQSDEDAYFERIGRGGNVAVLAGSNVYKLWLIF